MEHTPFSVAISVYKNDDAINFDRALESITIKQTIIPNEIVMIVDGEVPQSIESVIHNYATRFPFIHVIRLPQNNGLGNALRIAVEHCKYERIARMDSDDISVRDRFEQQLALMDAHPEVDIVGGNISEFTDLEDHIIAYRNVPVSDTAIKDYIKKRCPFNHVTVMYKKQAVLKAGRYIDLYWNEDYYLWIRMFECNCTMLNTGTVLVNVRVGQEMYKRRGGKKYFESEKFLQKYMLDHKFISKSLYTSNVLKRLVVQRILPNYLRGWIFKTFARS